MLIADTHVHLYAMHDAARAMAAAHRQLTSGYHLSGDALIALFLTEKSGDHAFDALRDGRRSVGPRFSPATSGETNALRFSLNGGGPDLLVVAGRQLATAEGIEVLALGIADALPDGLSAAETVAAIRHAGGLPVVSWSPGKWCGRRSSVVAGLIANNRPALGDIAMRPRGFPEPALMREARRAGLPVLAGTDPLPRAGEEDLVGSYGVVVRDIDTARPAASALAALARGAFSQHGQRQSVATAARRWLAHRFGKTS